ncbi:MAG: hypothetical protein JWO95_410 [Verrucomicrobiales bacterium]|nr:hypothetical protein [Verrucomicrobiales bacterium]
MKSIVSGIILIVLGFLYGDSVFTGHFGMMSLFFDGLGLLFIGKGAYQLWRDRQPQQSE